MKKYFSHIFSYFLQGLFALLPLIVSWFVITFLFRLAKNSINDILILMPQHLMASTVWAFILEALTFLSLIALIVGFGFLIKTLVGKTLISKVDSFFSSIPFLKLIYRATRQLVDMLGSKKSESFFTQPVLVEYPSKGNWVIAFKTGAVSDPEGSGREFSTVFIPTTPNPTSGFMVITERVRPFNVAVEDAVKMVLTGGVIKSEIKPDLKVA
ncbi:DUF502 domain-containing protein [Chitinispirillales bacterium ANBcel5]|uniref:DUF502 domain-containing protein n=1 Tax=Cellulosispirillum alkaliphilum TaxID=3039283 RepID=UPI002A504263|nr:DUF502 domain-containing protein [Chitinispirillales bacterium ANBcel5]